MYRVHYLVYKTTYNKLAIREWPGASVFVALESDESFALGVGRRTRVYFKLVVRVVPSVDTNMAAFAGIRNLNLVLLDDIIIL